MYNRNQERNPNTLPSLKKNLILNTILTCLNIVFPLLTLGYTARILGPISMGTFYFAANLAAYFLVLSGSAIPYYAVREIAKVRENKQLLKKTFSEIFVINLVLSLIATAVFVLAVLLTPKFHRHSEIFFIMSGLLVFQSVSVDYLFQGMEQYGRLAIRTIISKSLALILIFILVREPSDYFIFAIIYSGSSLFSNLLGFYNIRNITQFQIWNLDLKKHIKPLTPLLLFFLVGSIYANFDSVLLGLLTDEYSVGIYNVASKTIRLVVTVISALGIVLVPRFSYLFINGQNREFEELASRALEYLYLMVFLLGTSFFFAAPVLIPAIFGNKFGDAIATVQLVIPNIFIITIATFLGMQILFPMGKEKILAISTIAASSVSLILGFLLIPKFKYNGSAITSVFSELTMLVILLILARRNGVKIPFFEKKYILYPLCSSLIAVPALIANWICGAGSYYVLIAIGLGLVLFLGVWRNFRKAIATEIFQYISNKFIRIY